MKKTKVIILICITLITFYGIYYGKSLLNNSEETIIPISDWPTVTIQPTNNITQAVKPNTYGMKAQDFYEIDCDGYNYTIILYDKNRNKVYEENVDKEPYVSIEDNDIIRITISVGSPLNYTFFYDTTDNIISLSYENALLIADNKIVYMKNSNTLVISDFFDTNKYYKEISRDFSPTAVPSLVIGSVKFIETNNLQLVYLKGKDFENETETIDLDEIPDDNVS